MKKMLFLLPGMLCGEESWAEQIAALSDIAICHVIDYGLARSQLDMAQLVLARASTPFAVAGHSLGGRVALQVQRLAPMLTTHLALVGSSADGHAGEEARAAETALRRKQLAYAKTYGMRAFAESWAPQNILADHLQNVALMERFYAMVGRRTPEEMEAQINSGLTRPDMMGWLPDISARTLVLAGEDDAGRPPQVHRLTAKSIPGSTLNLVPKSGHMVTMEQPEAVNAALRVWLQ